MTTKYGLRSKGLFLKDRSYERSEDGGLHKNYIDQYFRNVQVTFSLIFLDVYFKKNTRLPVDPDTRIR